MRIKLILFISLLSSLLFAQKKPYMAFSKTSVNGKYEYVEIFGDPAKARHYTLPNGLTVIISENHLEPRIMSLIVTKAGSKNDPSNNTGLAHYLEHMLFKGTDRMGTLDYGKEKAELDRIEALYEKYNRTGDQVVRKEIYRQIDSISGVAAQYAIANEYDKLMADLGSNMTNAFTSFENTTYMENFPSNNLDKFLQIQAERFRKPVLRLFHTELEAVYEEKNISLDNGENKIFENLFASLFPNHPYGTQTTIGTIEHLKNPSLVEIQKYYDRYYVPSNMAIILAGDLNPDEAIATVDKYFGLWQGKKAPVTFQDFQPGRDTIHEITVYSPDEEKVAIGFVLPHAHSLEANTAELVSGILYNGKSGVIDKDLVLSQKILEGYGFTYLLKERGVAWFQGKPKEGQRLEEVRDLFLATLKKLKTGDFDESLIEGTVNNLRISRIRNMEKATSTAFMLHDAFVLGKPWVDVLNQLDAMADITKQDIQRFAAMYFQDNYTVVYKRTGEDTKIQKVEKPAITPVEVNRNEQSEFVKSMMAIQSPELEPKFLDFDKEIQQSKLTGGVPLWYVRNPINDLFTLYYKFDMGSYDHPKMALALDYLKYLGTNSRTNEQINSEMYLYGLNWDVSVSGEEIILSLDGLETHFDRGIALLEDMLSNPKEDKVALDDLIDNVLKSRRDNLLIKDKILNDGMQNYLRYGPENPFNTGLTNDELRKITPAELIALIKSLSRYEHKVMYCGARPHEHLTRSLATVHKTPDKPLAPVKGKPFSDKPITESTVYFVDYDMVQADLTLRRGSGTYDAAKEPIVRAFNEYYGGGMASIVFQDIRESRALAYSARSNYGIPSRADKPFSAMFYVGTQADKVHDAMGAIYNLLNEMPKSENLWEVNKKVILSGIQTQRINKEAILFSYEAARKKGLNYDIRKDIYRDVAGITLDDIEGFHAQEFKNKHWNIGIIGAQSRIDIGSLKKYGNVKVLSLKDLFGYDESDFSKP